MQRVVNKHHFRCPSIEDFSMQIRLLVEFAGTTFFSPTRCSNGHPQSKVSLCHPSWFKIDPARLKTRRFQLKHAGESKIQVFSFDSLGHRDDSSLFNLTVVAALWGDHPNRTTAGNAAATFKFPGITGTSPFWAERQ
jgi:hypothetical protein